jgi:drug/metabolite transporter (DMT)-like permease
MNTQKGKGVLLTVVSILLGSVTPVLNKFALLESSSAAASSWNALFSILIAGLMLLGSQRKNISVPWIPVLLIGLCHALGLVLMYSSLNILEPVTVSLLGRFYVVFAVLMGVFVLKERLKLSDLIVFPIAILGSFLFMNRGGTGNFIGVIFAIGYTFSFALENLLCKRLIHKTSIYLISFCVNLTSLFFISTFMLIKNKGEVSFL